jgi:hypothetical protein
MNASTTMLAMGVLVCTLPKDCQTVLNASYDYLHRSVQVTCGNTDGNVSTYLSVLGDGKGTASSTQGAATDRVTYRRGDFDKIQCE